MTKYVKGLKRQQIIQRWLQGHDDKEFEVFPTKVEGKYIVKKRTDPLPEQVSEEPNEQTDEPVTEEVNETATEESTEEVKPKPKKQAPKPKPKPKQVSIPTIPKHIRESNPQDLTISYEILNQLKELGNEIKQQRIKKEQKSMIKQVVQKQITKRPRKQIVKEPSTEDEDKDEYEYEPPKPQHRRSESIAIKNDIVTEQPPPQPVFRSRIRR